MTFAELKTAFETLCKGFKPDKEFDTDNSHFITIDPDDMLRREYKTLKQYIKDLREQSTTLEFKSYSDGFAMFDESGVLYHYKTTIGMPLIGFACVETPEELITAIDAYVSKVQNNMLRIENKVKMQRPTFNTSISM